MNHPPPRTPERTPAPTPRPPTWRWLLLLQGLPGLLAGFHLTGLVFFLNPDLPYRPGPFLRAFSIYGLLLAALSCLLLIPLTRRGLREVLRSLPWSFTAILAAAAILYWYHASHFSYFLPPGINTRMIKAAVWLSLCGLVCFYTALLHSLADRPYGLRSRIGITVVVVSSILITAERREAFKPRVAPEPLPSMLEPDDRPALLVAGIEGATLEALLPLARQGRLPLFGRMLEAGAYARTRSIAPPVRSALWTTLATGELPYRHGVVADRVYPAVAVGPGLFLRLIPRHLGFGVWGTFARSRPAGAGFRRSVALWEVLQRLDVSTGLVGWPLTYPAPETPGYTFSDRFFQGRFESPAARPDELAGRGVYFRQEPAEIDAAVLERFGDRVPFYLLEALAEDLWRASLTGFLMDQRPDVRTVFVVLPGLAEVSRRSFGGYAATQSAGHPAESEQEAAELLTAYYRLLDGLLEGLWNRLPEPRVLAVVSGHGLEAPRGWRKVWAEIAGTSVRGRYQEAPDGVFLLLGHGVRPGASLERQGLIDVMPTLAYALGLPIARDIDGRVLTSAFDSQYLARHPLAFVPSYQTLEIRPGSSISPVALQE